MILEKRLLPDDPTPIDAPPAYDAVLEGASRNQKYDHKSLPPQPDSNASSSASSSSGSSSSGASSSRPPTSPRHSKVPLSSPVSPTSPSSSSLKGKNGPAQWFNFNPAAHRTNREVRTTVLRLVRELVQEHLSTSPAATGILHSCADACLAHGLDLSSILQEKSIENHTPLYWAVVKRVPDEQSAHETGADLLTALISFASPLTPDTINEIRVGCLATSDQKLFQRLRMSPEFAPMSGVDQMLLGGTIPPDEIEVEGTAEKEGNTFKVTFQIPHFQKRMAVSKQIVLEFIAKGRMWSLTFFVAEGKAGGPTAGSWCISLGLLHNSPPTFLDSSLVIPETRAPSDETSGPSELPPLPSSDPQSSAKRAISIRLKTSDYTMVEAPKGKHNSGHPIVVSLEQSKSGGNLQYGNSIYIGHDETLRGSLEAKLGKPQSDCIIC